jgi:putative membrane protein
VLVYGALGLSSVPYFVAAPDGAVTDPTGTVWSGHAIDESMMIINLFSVVPVALLAVVRLAGRDSRVTEARTTPAPDAGQTVPIEGEQPCP